MFAKYCGFNHRDQYEFVLLVMGGHPPNTDPRDSTSLYNSACYPRGERGFLPTLQQCVPTAKSVSYSGSDVKTVNAVDQEPERRFSETAMKTFLDGNRIMIYGSGNHACLLTGYRTQGDKVVFIAVDPEAGGPVPISWLDFNTADWIVYKPK